MPQWVIVGHFIVDAETPDEARDWLADELKQRLGPGEEGSPWQDGVGKAPSYQLASIQRITGESPTQRRKK